VCVGREAERAECRARVWRVRPGGGRRGMFSQKASHTLPCAAPMQMLMRSWEKRREEEEEEEERDQVEYICAEADR